MMHSFIIENRNNIWLGSFPLITAAGFINGCSCRLHGESELVPGNLNLALHVGDATDKVVANRQLFADALGIDASRFTTCQQVHGDKIKVITEKEVGSGAVDYNESIAGTDALITGISNIPLVLFYADCVPIILADPKTGTIGLVHAGWHGTVAEIAGKTAKAMQTRFGSCSGDILAAIGPSIGRCCYDVDDFVRQKAIGYEDCFIPSGSGKYKLDLWKMNTMQLINAGVVKQHIIMAGICTRHNNELFFSYRAEQGTTGRMGVCICRK
ncbi:MAG: peptidoglycan editing factor PgeF [Phascolarctobacterium sp.]|nr:peptidoglycan editing factor PgeF [Phascolarctobacterium sp.]